MLKELDSGLFCDLYDLEAVRGWGRSGNETSSSKRQRMQDDSIDAAIQILEVQNEVYALRRFSDRLTRISR